MKKTLFSLSFIFSFLFSSSIFCQTNPPKNTRTFETNLFVEYAGFIKHSNENNSEIYYSSFDYNGKLYIKKFSTDGTLNWKISISNADDDDISLSKHSISFDKDDNFFLCFNPKGGFSEHIFTDINGQTQNINPLSNTKSILKFDKAGNLLWKKDIDFLTNYSGLGASIYSDNNGDVYITGKNQTSENSLGHDHFYILKLDGRTGSTIFKNDYIDVGIYSSFSLVDTQNNFYVFLDSYSNKNNYNFDGVSINSSFPGDTLMLKFDSSGKIILGKNFYANNTTNLYGSAKFSDGLFDGNNIILLGYLSSSDRSSDFVGLNHNVIARKYPTVYNQGLLAKIDLSANVIWEKPLFSNFNVDTGVYTNLNIDSDENIYSYLYFKDKLSIDNTEYQFDALDGNKVVAKFDTDGKLQYLNPVDNFKNSSNSSDYSSTMIDVIDNDTYSIASVTSKSNFLNYPLYNYYIAKNYIATFGNLTTKYLTPENNYLELSNVDMSNNSENANVFSFNLINNVDWSASSDQSWLNLSFQSLTGRSAQNLISGTGDAKISLTADTNNTGADRTANVLLSGDGGVASKTIAITQSGTLATGESKTFTTTLYPNPTSDFLNIKTQQKISKIEIYDLSGKLLKVSTGKDNKVSVSSFSKGMYLIKIYTDNGVVNSKFIKN